MRIVFVRHGHPDYTRDCLTELGKKQAAAAAQRIRGEGVSRVFSSTNGRALETAGFTADLLGLTVEKCDFMREVTWWPEPSPWEMIDERVAAGIPLLDAAWDTSPDFGANGRLIRSIRACQQGTEGWLASLGYVREGAYFRVTEAAQADQTVAAFGHGGETAAVLSFILGAPYPFVCASMGPDFTGVTIVQLPYRPGELVTPRFEIMNDARHIAGGEIAYGQ